MITDLNPETVYDFVLTAAYDPDGDESDGVSFSMETIAVPDAENVTAAAENYHSVNIDFEKPILNEYEKTVLYYDGSAVAETEHDYFFNVEGLEPGMNHEFSLVTVTNDGHESEGVTVSAETPEAPEIEDVRNVYADPDYNRVDLGWQNPQYNPNFEKVKIYRKDIENESVSFNLFGSRVSAAEDEYDPLFETNGTTFNDLSVEPESEYEYKLTTENVNGVESDGVFVQASTETEPPPEMGGISGDENEDGSYTISWSSPTTGEVEIMVGGSTYVTVPAADGTYTIPEADMSWTAFGNPNVSVVPISEYGTVGGSMNPDRPFSASSLPFSAADLLSSSVAIMTVFGGFLLLGLVILLFPRIIKLFRRAIQQRQVQAKVRR